MFFDQTDQDNLSLVTWKEARGEGNEGMQAVMHVIVNRVGHPGFAHTLHDVIYGKNQFTSMSVSSDPEFNLTPKQGDPQYAFCESLCPAVLSGTDTDVTMGAHYYADLKYTTSGWFFRNIVNNPTDHPQVASIGRHTFYL
jgi:spore germination cell wall hydrolase CwlJ-like protein